MATVSNDSSEPMRRVMEIPGFGPIGVGRFVAALGAGQVFKCGRVLSAWLRLTLCQHSTGGKPVLFGIGKRGHRYLCTMLIHSARAVLRRPLKRKKTQTLSAVGSWKLQNTALAIRRSLRLPTIWGGSVGWCWPKTYSTTRNCSDGLTKSLPGAFVNKADCC